MTCCAANTSARILPVNFTRRLHEVDRRTVCPRPCTSHCWHGTGRARRCAPLVTPGTGVLRPCMHMEPGKTFRMRRGHEPLNGGNHSLHPLHAARCGGNLRPPSSQEAGHTVAIVFAALHVTGHARDIVYAARPPGPHCHILLTARSAFPTGKPGRHAPAFAFRTARARRSSLGPPPTLTTCPFITD